MRKQIFTLVAAISFSAAIYTQENITGIWYDNTDVGEYYIVILNNKSGKPYINIIGQTKKLFDKKFKKKKIKISLSLSDEKKYAVAFVTISL